MVKVLRTPEACFDNLPDYTFAPHYTQITDDRLGELRVHYVNEPGDNTLTVLMMHGEPSWSYLYRKMITHVNAQGYPVIAPDLIGFGKSDKPVCTDDYSYSAHVAWMSEWFLSLDLQNVVLFCQDWGGLIGLRLVANYPDRFAGVVVANTFLPTGEGKPSQAFENWKQFSKTVPEFPVGGVIRGATVKPLGDGVEAAYNAPFPDETYKAGARIFPSLVPVTPDMDGAQDNKKAWQVLKSFKKPFLTAFSDKDPITRGNDVYFQTHVPGAVGQPHTQITGGGHFLQEDCPDELSSTILRFCAALNPNNADT